MSDLLSIGASGVRAYQTALTTTSENIANADVAGYARRTTRLDEVRAAGGAQSRTINGSGVVASAVVRTADAFRQDEVRRTGADLARTEAGIGWLERIENSLSASAVDTRIDAFFAAATRLAADPTAGAARATLLETASGVAGAFATARAGLDAAMGDLDAQAEATVGSLNALTAALARVNGAIGRSSAGTSGSAALLDQRDAILEQMSAISDVNVTLDAAGRAQVRAGGPGGPLLVSGDQAATLTYVRADDGGASFAVHGDDGIRPLLPQGGALAGIADGAQRIGDAARALDAVATQFVDAVNQVQAQGDDANGMPGQPIFAIGDPPARISLVMGNPAAIAAAARGAGGRDNSNAVALATLGRTTGAAAAIADLTTGNAAALSARRTLGEAQRAMHDGAVGSRDAASAVNTDEEAVDLLRFQKAYQASSKVIQTARDIFETLLNIR